MLFSTVRPATVIACLCFVGAAAGAGLWAGSSGPEGNQGINAGSPVTSNPPPAEQPAGPTSELTVTTVAASPTSADQEESVEESAAPAEPPAPASTDPPKAPDCGAVTGSLLKGDDPSLGYRYQVGIGTDTDSGTDSSGSDSDSQSLGPAATVEGISLSKSSAQGDSTGEVTPETPDPDPSTSTSTSTTTTPTTEAPKKDPFVLVALHGSDSSAEAMVSDLAGLCDHPEKLFEWLMIPKSSYSPSDLEMDLRGLSNGTKPVVLIGNGSNAAPVLELACAIDEVVGVILRQPSFAETYSDSGCSESSNFVVYVQHTDDGNSIPSVEAKLKCISGAECRVAPLGGGNFSIGIVGALEALGKS